MTAVDGGSPQLTGTVDVVINVEDINDNPPSFPTTAILANVKENLPIGSKIRRIGAQDSDLGDNGRIEYSLKGTEDFKIDSDTGDLFTNVKLDREVTDSYTVGNFKVLLPFSVDAASLSLIVISVFLNLTSSKEIN